MAKQISSLSVALFSTVEPFTNGLKTAAGAIGGFVGQVAHAGTALLSMTGIASAVGGVIGGALSLGKGFELASELETANVQFTALSGSAQNAANILTGLRDFAANSPFSFPDLDGAAKRLLAVGVRADAITPLLKQVGDVAAGVGAPIGDIAGAFERVAAEGSLTSRELRELGHQGIPLMQTLAQQYHTNAAGIEAMADSGQLGFAQLETAFQAMTGPGGRFAGILAAQSGTIGGVFHNLVAAVEDSSADIAEGLINAFDLRPALGYLAQSVGGIGQRISGALQDATPAIHQFIDNAVGTFQRLYAEATPYLSELWTVIRVAFAGITSTVEVAGGLLVNLYTSYWQSLYGFVAPIVSAIGQVVGDNWQAIIGTTVAFATGMVTFAEGAFSALVTIASGVFNAVVAIFDWGWSLVTGRTVAAGQETATAFSSIGSMAGWLVGRLTDTAVVLGYVFGHIGDVTRLAGLQIAATVVQIGGWFAYTFTEVIPAYLGWFGRQALATFLDFASNTETIFTNVMMNVANVVTNLPALIKGQVSFDQLWFPITNGFRATMEALPQIAARQQSALEQTLDGQAKELGGKLGDGLGDALDAQRKNAAASAKKITDSITDAMAPLGKPQDIPAPNITPPPPVDLKTALDPANLTLGVQPEIKKAKAIRRGSAESLAAEAVPAQRIIAPNVQAIVPQQPPAAPVVSVNQPPAVSQNGTQPAPSTPVAGIAAATQRAVGTALSSVGAGLVNSGVAAPTQPAPTPPAAAPTPVYVEDARRAPAVRQSAAPSLAAAAAPQPVLVQPGQQVPAPNVNVANTTPAPAIAAAPHVNVATPALRLPPARQEAAGAYARLRDAQRVARAADGSPRAAAAQAEVRQAMQAWQAAAGRVQGGPAAAPAAPVEMKPDVTTNVAPAMTSVTSPNVNVAAPNVTNTMSAPPVVAPALTTAQQAVVQPQQSPVINMAPQPVPPVQVQPIQASVPGVSAATTDVQKSNDQKQADQLKAANDWLYRIEFNTRPLQTQAQAQTVSL